MKGLFILLTFVLGLSAKSQILHIDNISNDLKSEANVVIRSSLSEFVVVNSEKAIETYHLELTILNDKGNREAEQYVFYSDLEKILSLNGELYDKFGQRIKKIKNSDIQDISASGSNMYTDNRLKVLDFSNPVYPFSIVLDYKIEHNGLMFYPRWIPQDNLSTAVAKAEFRVVVPKSIDINHYERFVDLDVVEEDEDKIYSWVVENVKAFRSEPYSPPLRDLVPMVMVTPKEFKMEGYTGSMDSWESIGAYKFSLIDGKQDIPYELRSEVETAILGVTDKRERAKIIYDFVQNSTRYVSVQLGIGGWEPFDVNYVFENGYGDCKALTNYTMALLDFAGIESIYTSVYAGRGEADIVTEFPNARFNHVFLAVPMESDTIWLECTSQTNPFGYLGSFTSDRHVLLTNKDGGKLVKTPTYDEHDNTQLRKIDIDLSEEGDATANVITVYSGLQYENVDHQIYEPKQEQKKWLLKNIDMKDVSIEDVIYEQDPDVIPSITEKIILTSKGFASATGKRIFLNANAMNRQTFVPKKINERKSEIIIRTAYTDIDSVYYKIPESFHIEHLPESIAVKTKFGEYSVSYLKTEDGILYIRKNVRYKGTYSADSYDEFRTMLKDIVRYDKTKVVLTGST